MGMSERAFIGVGGNLGGRDQVARTIARAADLLRAADGIAAVLVSPLYVTEPWGVTEQETFVNAVFAADTTLEPPALLGLLKRLEGELGREETFRWGPRVIDMDILLFGERRQDRKSVV